MPLKRESWRSPRGDWVLEILDGNGPRVRAVPRFDEPSGDRLGALWLPAPTRVRVFAPETEAPARAFTWPRGEDPRPGQAVEDAVAGREPTDLWVKVGRYALTPQGLAVAATSAGGDAAWKACDRARLLPPLRDWVAAVVDRATKCRARGIALVWAEIVQA